MELRSGYKNSELGTIPSDWDAVHLGDIGEALIGLTYRPMDVKESGTLVLRSSNIQDDKLTLRDNVFVDVDIPERIRVRAGDVLVCVRNGSRELIGKSTYLDRSAEGMTFGAFMAVYRSPYGKLVSFLFQSNILKRQIGEHLGATINQITNKSLNSFQIALPPSEAEQSAIATALSDMDALLAAQDALIAKKRAIKQGAMQELLTGKRRLPGFGREWELRRLGDCLRTNPSYGINAPAVAYSDQLPTYIRITDISEDGRFTPSPRVSVNSPYSLNYVLSEGDVVFARTGASVGKSYLFRPEDGELVVAGFLIQIQPDQTILNSAFLAAYVATGAYWSWVKVMSMRSGQPGINGAEFAELELPVPIIEEQTAIAGLLSDMDAEIIALEAKRAKTAQLKQGMMQELLTGRIRLV